MFVLLIIFLTFLIVLFITFTKKSIKFKNNKLTNFKKNLISKESKIDKIFSRRNEELNNDPNLNIKIGIHERQEDILLKSNIHRARLAKFNKSKLNGEVIYKDEKGEIYKLINRQKIYL